MKKLLFLLCLLPLCLRAANPSFPQTQYIAYTNLFGTQPMMPVITSASKVSSSWVISNNITGSTNNVVAQEPSPVWVPERNRFEAAFNTIGTLAASKWRIYVAYGDGTNWTNISSTPAIIPSLSAWDGNGQPGPYLYNLTGTNWLFYGGTPTNNTAQLSMGVAFSTDGTNYTESGSNPILTYGSTTNFYEPMVTMVGSTWFMLANADANGSTGLGIYRFTAPAATGPWSFGPKVINGTNDFAGQAQGGGLANFSSSNIWAFIDNNNIADNYGVRRGVSVYWTSNALTGAWQYVGDTLTHSANGDWDAKAMGTEGACITTNGQVLLMYAAPLTAANQSIGAAIITTGFQPTGTNGGYLSTAAQPEWVRISQEQGRQSGVVHVWSDAGSAAASGLGTGPEDLWFAYSVSYDDGSVSAAAGTYGWIQQIVYGSNPNIGTMVDQARIGSVTANSGTFLDIHVNQAVHVYVSTTCTTPVSFVESPSTAGTSLQPAISFNTNNVPQSDVNYVTNKPTIYAPTIGGSGTNNTIQGMSGGPFIFTPVTNTVFSNLSGAPMQVSFDYQLAGVGATIGMTKLGFYMNGYLTNYVYSGSTAADLANTNAGHFCSPWIPNNQNWWLSNVSAQGTIVLSNGQAFVF